MMYAMFSGAGAGSADVGWLRTAGSSMSTIRPSNLSSRDRASAVVMAAIGAASPSTNSNRASGTPGSIGT